MGEKNQFSLFEEDKLLFRQYICENSVAISVDDEREDLNLFDDILKSCKVFLAGENHGVSINEKMKVKLLKYFVRNANVKYYLIETGYIDSIMLNRYLKTGDENILDSIYKSYSGYYIGSQEGYKAWKDIYTFNQTLPEDKKIEVIGIDSISDFHKSVEYIYSILPRNKVIPFEIQYVIEGLKKVYNIFLNSQQLEFDQYTFWITYMQSIKIHRDIYKEYLKEDYFDFYMITKNLITIIKRKMNMEKSKEIREKALYDNFIDIYNERPCSNYFGQFGCAHVSNPYNIVESFASRLNNNVTSPVNNKVLSINYLYNNCKTMIPLHDGSGKYKTGNINLHILLKELFSEFFITEANLVRLIGKNTPFTNTLMNKSEFLEEFTTDNIQFCILFNGAKECTPYGTK
ncbi:hypothetical protein [Clostridium sp. BNL1100]|uniref:hypothetical protein n=1 Tax=Clostridium sp. BNL1100 TaxID=755731 RepID=UPI00024A7AE1|nr:hypothetical protein [Clostridium sp. BNL1100]AEY67465.1 hypothetical protein Clo1100_3320 [Clostridium sp. BNL1100]